MTTHLPFLIAFALCIVLAAVCMAVAAHTFARILGGSSAGARDRRDDRTPTSLSEAGRDARTPQDTSAEEVARSETALSRNDRTERRLLGFR